jgi:hypothetical protein
MSARVVPLDDTAEVARLLDALDQRIASGAVRAVAFVLADAAGGLETWWGATGTLGPHAGSILRGAVAYLGARMDAEALAPAAAPIAYGGGDTWIP